MNASMNSLKSVLANVPQYNKTGERTTQRRSIEWEESHRITAITEEEGGGGGGGNSSDIILANTSKVYDSITAVQRRGVISRHYLQQNNDDTSPLRLHRIANSINADTSADARQLNAKKLANKAVDAVTPASFLPVYSPVVAAPFTKHPNYFSSHINVSQSTNHGNNNSTYLRDSTGPGNFTTAVNTLVTSQLGSSAAASARSK